VRSSAQFAEFGSVRAEGDRVVFRAGAPNHPTCMVNLSDFGCLLRCTRSLGERSSLSERKFLSQASCSFSTRPRNWLGFRFGRISLPKKEKLDWRRSIVDLMKLLDLDSSLSARKQLAQELHHTGDSNDSAAMNIWLHKQVMRKLAENGGKVPADLQH
jgi:hypothetical protein